jgi:hypothetical protein
VTRIIRCVKHVIVIGTDTRFRRIVFSCLVLLATAPLFYRCYCHFRADLLAQREKTVAGYTRAIAYDIDNAELWWIRGRLRHYSPGASDLPAAIQDYERALSLNPRLGQAWMDLADCQERMGNFPKAEKSIQRALEVWTHSPIVQWQAGNFYLLHGNLEKMYKCFRTAIDYDPSKLDIALQVTWKADPDRSRILSMLVPDRIETNLRSLAFFVDHGELDLARPAWERFLQNRLPAGFSTSVSAAFPYIDALLARNRAEDAYRVWVESLDKNVMNRGRPRSGQQFAADSATDPTANLVWNGSFEDEILNGGFDWRQQETDGAEIRIDRTVHVDGLRSLKVTFNRSNIDFAHLSQILSTPTAGTYRLQYSLKTLNLTTDQRPCFSIESSPHPRDIILNTESFPSLSSWRKYSVPFKVRPGIKAVKLSLRRSPSEKFDNKIQGSLWLDSIAIHLDNPRSGTAREKTDD